MEHEGRRAEMDFTKIIVCRRASDYLKPGFVAGYRCAICEKELQASPEGVRDIASGGVAVCNPCGFRLGEELSRKGNMMAVMLNPSAFQQVIERLQKARSAGNN
jgi:DNA-directed RNA polymerase subunit RPC12/RpoP